MVILEEDSKREFKKTPSSKELKKSEPDEKEEENGGLSNYELNALSYEAALDIDHRKFWDMYWYLLRREHIIIFTFVGWNDYNLFSLKLSKLFLTICSDMAFNVFFFSDESMHKLYTSGDTKVSLSIVKCIRNKIIAFYISTTIFFLFFWYAASAFCAVYANTQGIFVADSYMSSLMGLTYPFALYFISAGLRFLSLKLKGKKKLKILYSLSGKIPLF